MEIERIWRTLVSRKWLLIGLPLFAGMASLGLAYLLPEQYESASLVLARPFEELKSDARASERKEIRDFPVNLSAPIDAPSKTIIEVIKSPTVAVRIVSALHLDVEKTNKTDGVFGAEIDKAKRVLGQTMKSIRNYLRYGRDIPASRFDLAVTDILEKLVVAPRKDTYAFEIKYFAASPDEAAAVANMASEIFLEQSSESFKKEAMLKREFFERQLKDGQAGLDRTEGAIQAYKRAGGIFDLNSEYAQDLKTLAELRDTITKLQGKLDGFHKLVLRTHTATTAPYEAQIAEATNQVRLLKARLALFPAKETRLNELLLMQRLAQQNYEVLAKSYQQARVTEAFTEPEIRIVSRALPSLYPVKPLKFVYAGMGFVVAFVLAIGWVLMFDAFDPRIRTVRDLEADVGLPVVGIIPRLRSLKQTGI